MNIRTAILSAADSIEKHPKLFDFDTMGIPDSDFGTPGCALGWIAFHLGDCEFSTRSSWSGSKVGACLSLMDANGPWAGTNFYDRMRAITGTYSWRKSATKCASALRLYADRYHALQPESFWKRVNVGDPKDCWEWTGYIGIQGYGRLRMDSKYWCAHRLAYTSAYGEIPTGKNRADYVVMHSCDNRPCCNPAHLSLGTGRENVLDAARKGRYKHRKNDPRTKIGSDNNAAILNEAQVAEIKLLISLGVTQAKMAKHYGVSESTISTIAVRRNWPQVEPAQGIPDSVLEIFKTRVTSE